MKRNAYTCRTCGKTIVTIDEDEGTTPFMLAHTSIGAKCAGMMQSHVYRGEVVESDAAASFVWRKPTPKEYRAARRLLRYHFDQGGLGIYPISS